MVAQTTRLRHRGEFQRVFREGRSYANSRVVLYCLRHGEAAGGGGRSSWLRGVEVKPGEKKGLRVAFSVGKKVGGAVIRNRARRLLREAFRHLAEGVQGNADLVFVGRRTLVEADCAKVEAAILDLLRRAGLFKNKGVAPLGNSTGVGGK